MKSKPRWMTSAIKAAKAEANAPKARLKAIRKPLVLRSAEPVTA